MKTQVEDKILPDPHGAAMKYLELARGEILEKVRFVNQTLGAYLLGSSAVAAWFYQVYKPSSVASATTPKDLAAVGFAAVLSYLSLGVSWIIHHNERIVTALALYQKNELSRYLGNRPPMWEASDALKDHDGATRSTITIFIQQMIILTPPVFALIFTFREFHQLTFWVFWLRNLALIATLTTLAIGFLTAGDRIQLRRHAK